MAVEPSIPQITNPKNDTDVVCTDGLNVEIVHNDPQGFQSCWLCVGTKGRKRDGEKAIAETGEETYSWPFLSQNIAKQLSRRVPLKAVKSGHRVYSIKSGQEVYIRLLYKVMVDGPNGKKFEEMRFAQEIKIRCVV